MLKKIGFVTAGVAAGMVMMSGFASAESGYGGDWPSGGDDGNNLQNGLVNLNDTNVLNNVDVLHNVNAVIGVCDNNINVLGIQVPIQDVANGLGIPVLSPGVPMNETDNSETCAVGGIQDGGTSQNNSEDN